MFAFTDSERAYLTEESALATDSAGIEVLAGLTVEETAFLTEHRRKFAVGIRDLGSKRRALELGEKHEVVRLAILGAEAHRRNSDAPLH